MMWLERAARTLGGYTSKTPALCVLRKSVKIRLTSCGMSKPYVLSDVSTMRQPPLGIIARLSGASVWRPTMSSFFWSM
jgi:hypothetical protein